MEIEARAPVVTPYSHMLPTPHTGFGLYERSGWKAGERGERMVTFTRTSGPSRDMTFDVTWQGNEHGTFSSPLTVTLPLGEPVEFPVTVTPAGHGVHTAHLTLDHEDVAGYAHRMHAAIVAPEPLNAANEYTAKNEVEVPRPGMKSLFFDVPEGVTALKIDVSWGERPVTLGVFRPDTRGQRGEMIQGGPGITQVVPGPGRGDVGVRLADIADTRTFDWEQAREEEPVPPTKATLTVSALAVDVEVVAGEMDDSTGEGIHQVWITNRMAAFEGAAVTTPAGSRRRDVGADRRARAEGVRGRGAAGVVGADGAGAGSTRPMARGRRPTSTSTSSTAPARSAARPAWTATRRGTSRWWCTTRRRARGRWCWTGPTCRRRG